MGFVVTSPPGKGESQKGDVFRVMTTRWEPALPSGQHVRSGSVGMEQAGGGGKKQRVVLDAEGREDSTLFLGSLIPSPESSVRKRRIFGCRSVNV